MSDRLAELRRQRALIHEHLNWLDREIAAAEKSSGSPLPATTPASAAPSPQITAPAWPAPASPAGGQPLPSLRPAEPPLVISVPEPAATPSRLLPRSFNAPAQPVVPSASLGEYRVSPGAVKEDVRKGCLLYFAAAFVLLFVGVGILWMIFRH